jgi:transposase, IS5 family
MGEGKAGSGDVSPAKKRQMKRREAIEPVIGHVKNGQRMDRNYIAHTESDRINAILASAGDNFHLLLNWLKGLLRRLMAVIFVQQKLQSV